MKRRDIFNNLLALGTTLEIDPTYSSIMRYLNKNKPALIEKFMHKFKLSFDDALSEKLDNPENLALMEAIQEINLNLHELI